ncbi:hypothetical protein PENARI_c002G08845 [Penicillium arizonense]|uniref:Uncharacterized protein n=1 Tax=Penicillium arizonense TaxID=1835702 RepID=A0A1F5LWJ1_PENAI|nr:hypothetical protein PENARI_c002G08845 [Penicillium arizonense]OGE57525.1 hypothetical protein PENARI_c002G08845 [Penicillium arizonense]
MTKNTSQTDLETRSCVRVIWSTRYWMLRNMGIRRLSIGKGHDELIETLLAHGADVDEEHLHEAILQSNKKPLEMLLAKYGAENCRSNLLELAALTKKRPSSKQLNLVKTQSSPFSW